MSKVKKILNKVYGKMNAAIRHTHWFNDVMFPDCSKFWNQREMGLDVVNLGSTSAKCGFDYTGTRIKAANWAMQPQSFVGDLAILENYCSYLKPGATVIIPMCPFSCLGGGSDDLADKYYSVIRYISIPHASLKKRQTIQNLMKFPWKYYPLYEMVMDFGRLFRTKKETIVPDFETDAIWWIESWKKEFSLYDLKYPFALINQDRFSESVEALRRLLEFCQGHGYKPVLVLLPMSKKLSSKLDESFRKQYIYNLIERANTVGAPFLNYLDDAEFEDDINYKNAYLIGREGAKKFTNLLLKDIF